MAVVAAHEKRSIDRSILAHVDPEASLAGAADHDGIGNVVDKDGDDRGPGMGDGMDMPLGMGDDSDIECGTSKYKRLPTQTRGSKDEQLSNPANCFKNYGFHVLFSSQGLFFDNTAVMSALLQQHAHGLPNAAVSTALLIARSNNESGPDSRQIPKSFEEAIG